MIEIVFLGTGSGIPSKTRNLSSIWMRYEKDCFLFDCGEGTQRQMISGKISFMKVDRIFITHWHADHWAGLIGLILTMNLEKRRKPLYIYAPEAERFVNDILDLGYWGPRFKVVPIDIDFEGDEITEVFHTKDYQVFSIPVEHTVPSVAFCFKEKDKWNVDIKKAGKYGLKQGPLVGKLKKFGKITLKGKSITLDDVGVFIKGLKVVYSGDTRFCKNLVKISKNADLLIHDATFAEETEDRSHAGAKEAAKVAKQAKVKKLVLTHFSRRYLDVSPLVAEAKKIFKNTTAAEDFMKIILKKDKILIK